MKKQLLTVLILSTTFVAKAQNLVPNGDFEQYSGCPTAWSQIANAIPWFDPVTPSESDYYNQCATNPSVGVPVNIGGYGFQLAHSGVAYGGIYIWYGSNVREYVEVPLISTLIANQCYHFEMYVNLYNNCQFTTDDIGVYFSNVPVTGMPPSSVLPFISQINNITGNVFDTLNWTLVSGYYFALGGESHIIIGNFKDDANTDTTLINLTGFPSVYVYFDDVCLTPCGSSCATGIEEHSQQNEITIYPNPASDYIHIRNLNSHKLKNIFIYNTLGEKVKAFEAEKSIFIGDLQQGLYFIKLITDKGYEVGKFVKE